MKIRTATSEDGRAIARIYRPVVELTAISFELTPPSAGEIAERITRTTARFPWIVAERDGEILGYGYAGPHRTRPAYGWTAETSVYVAEGARRTGVGRRLCVELIEILSRQHVATVLAGITLPNDASVGLHQALGFVPAGVYRRVGFKFGEWHDVGWWQLPLHTDETNPGEIIPFPEL